MQSFNGNLDAVEAIGCVLAGIPTVILGAFTRGAAAAGGVVGGGIADTCWEIQCQYEPDEDEPQLKKL